MIARGETADLSGLLAAADVGLNPVLAGGGSNIKLPTYLAAGLAVVTTPHGLRGFAALAPFVTVAEPAAMAEALRGRPAGWALGHAGGGEPPEPIAGYAWGRIGERLGDAFAARLAGAAREGGGAGGGAAGERDDGAHRRRA